MHSANRYYKCSELSEVKFCGLLCLFVLDLIVSNAARLTSMSVRPVNALYLCLHQFCPYRPS